MQSLRWPSTYRFLDLVSSTGIGRFIDCFYAGRTSRGSGQHLAHFFGAIAIRAFWADAYARWSEHGLRSRFRAAGQLSRAHTAARALEITFCIAVIALFISVEEPSPSRASPDLTRSLGTCKCHGTLGFPVRPGERPGLSGACGKSSARTCSAREMGQGAAMASVQASERGRGDGQCHAHKEALVQSSAPSASARVPAKHLQLANRGNGWKDIL